MIQNKRVKEIDRTKTIHFSVFIAVIFSMSRRWKIRGCVLRNAASAAEYNGKQWIPLDPGSVSNGKIYEATISNLMNHGNWLKICDKFPISRMFLGLDSSLVAAFARKILGPTHELHTFTIGLENAPDFKFARTVAEHIGSIHHEFTYTLQEGLDVIPQVEHCNATRGTRGQRQLLR